MVVIFSFQEKGCIIFRKESPKEQLKKKKKLAFEEYSWQGNSVQDIMLIGKAACQKCRYLWKLCDIHFEKKKHPYFKPTFNNIICYVQAYLCL